MECNLKGGWLEPPSLEKPLFPWLIYISLSPLDTNSIKTEAAVFLVTMWQSSWHMLFGLFLRVKREILP